VQLGFTSVASGPLVRSSMNAEETYRGDKCTSLNRIKRLPPYVFAIVNHLKMESRRQGEDIIDLGMGNPDLPTPKHIVDKLCEAAKNPKNHRYSAIERHHTAQSGNN